ncbi:VOC family protein [Serratia rubidaea]|uniref:3-demethylubiquinone-9 3-methyltransferase n=1 Tax=Serratia rubidaea TaxID=61652 RepID=A0A448SS89_SERRU|nr:VOC family protein [Serratia rubidaea]MBH1931959.1 VOC family protein [Serratia rubidaea]MDC6119203.1 VOC family protein [Serratia rubidaea]MEB7584912.1 VOC family protein [Serratia rubidaea]VEI70559.1 3-demethylubiquinone-9 3-methyltransferase [Serratia rubidaea]
MAIIRQQLWFAQEMEEALTCYIALFPGSKLEWHSTLPADSPSGPAGSVKMAGFILGDQRYLAFEAHPMDPFTHRFAIAAECDDQAEVDRLWAVLSEGGKTEPCGWLQDRWGISWQVVPKRLGELIRGDDRARAQRVAEAMLKMGKIDIAALEAAANHQG